MSDPIPYSMVDQLVYRIAFGGIGLQRDLAGIEEKVFSAQFSAITTQPAVFITGLPRSGTTLLLELLSANPAFCSHTYRDLPFVLCPLLWNRLARAGFREAELAPRHHGDGMLVSYDSPEALEEIIWKAFWPEHYGADRIGLWNRQEPSEGFGVFFRSHMRKIIALRKGAGRYLSKNNANIARIGLLRRLFPDCTILVPFREPLAQAQSMLRQHRGALQQHAKVPFTRRYAEWLGHHEFGLALKPFDFPGFDAAVHDPGTIDFWLAYWIAAYSHLLGQSGELTFVSYDGLCADPERGLRHLSARLSVPISPPGRAIHAAPQAHAPEEAIDPGLKAAAAELYQCLSGDALGAGERPDVT